MPPKILIVDDDPLMHRLYQHHLERAGFQFLSATSGRQALEVAAQELPQLIFMDVMMEEMTGLVALRELKKMTAMKDVPIIVITAIVGALAATKKEAETAGAAGFLTKPLSPSKLIAEIQRFIPSADGASPPAQTGM